MQTLVATVVLLMHCAKEPFQGFTCKYTACLFRFMRIFLIRGRSPAAIIEDCAYCMHFVVYWRRDVEQRMYTTLKKNFITAETYQDVLCVCQALIVMIKWFKQKFPNVAFHPSR